ncbi:spermidine coumaroyl-CoA acyltransferase-like [Corylus avellana]|uniref:spermidine coumaroyl-CoA acyltransferase-like n=1 Tax=Corylus avellana TaxID=13451 RepID=UPI00286A8080|nr:spermidine coumaroyl-CoA acyltransferase-like [Corylus avellana]
MENHHNTPLLLDRKDVVLVKPSKPTPSGVLSLSSIDNSPTHECLCQTVHVFRSKVDTSSSMSGQADPACVIKEALSQALVYYYPLAGKLNKCSDGKLQINCTADGVPFLEATANNSQLSSLHYLDGIDVEVDKQFVFNFPSKDDSGYHPLLLQVTKFSCGGFTIGMSLSHSVCDGSGAAQFFRALAELASGKSEPSVKPVWARERLMGRAPASEPLQFPSLAISPYLPTTDILHACFYVSSESIKTLKTSLIEEHCGTNESFTTVEVLGAYVWRSRFRALKLNPDQKTLFSMAVGIRNRLNSPPLPGGYYGNAFVSATVVLMGGELNEEPLSKVAKLIKESKKVASDREYIMNSLGIFEKFREHNIKIEASGGSMVLTDWRQLGFLLEEEVAVGAINVNFVPQPVNLFANVELCLFLPPSKVDDPSRKGGVRVLVSLPRAAMAKFEEEMDALCKLGDDGSLCKL